MKSFLFLSFLIVFLNGQDSFVAISSKAINWKGKLIKDNVSIIKQNNKLYCEKNIDFVKFKENKLRAKHYILPKKAICNDDVYEEKNNKIKFNFGFVEIQRDGELIKETNEYIKFRNPDGKIEKIYKDGR